MTTHVSLVALPVLAAALVLTGCPRDGGVGTGGESSETGDGDGDPAGDGDGDESSGGSDSVGDGDGDSTGDGDGDSGGDGDGDGDSGTMGDGDGDSAVCGDGVVEGEEACDDGNADNTDECLESCEPASCGDGFVWAGNEGCDDGNADNTDECLESCENASCGDGFVWADSEECDPAQPEGGEGCDAQSCTISALLLEDFEGEVEGWTHEAVGVQNTWNISQDRAASGMNSYHSGAAQESEGTLRLMSPSLDLTIFSELDTITLVFQQWYRYDSCNNDPSFLADGHILEVSVNDGPYQQLSPNGGYPDVLANLCENPLQGLEAWAQNSNDTFEAVSADLSSYVGATIKLAWTVGLDCGNCDLEPMLYLDDVSVIRTQE